MSGQRLPVPAIFRDAIRDSGLDLRAKLVAHTISTYMNGAGDAYPSKATIARGASMGVRTADRAIERLEAAGLLRVDRSGGRVSNTYRVPEALLTTSSIGVVDGEQPRRSPGVVDSSQPRQLENPTPPIGGSNPAAAVADESAESAEPISNARRRSRASGADEELIDYAQYDVGTIDAGDLGRRIPVDEEART